MTLVRDREAAVEPTQRRRHAALAVLAAAMASLVVIASVVTWSALRSPADPGTLSIDGLEVEVTAFTRRVDAMMGVNTPKQRTNGPAMSMPNMGSIPGALPHGQERVDLRVEVRNVGRTAAGLDADLFQLWSGSTRVELLQPTVSDLTGVDVSPGSRLVGTLTFVVAEGTSPLALRHPGDEGSVTLDDSVQATSLHAGASSHE